MLMASTIASVSGRTPRTCPLGYDRDTDEGGEAMRSLDHNLHTPILSHKPQDALTLFTSAIPLHKSIVATDDAALKTLRVVVLRSTFNLKRKSYL